LQQGDTAAALHDADEAVLLAPRSSDAYEQKAECYRALDDWSEVAAALDAAHALTPAQRKAELSLQLGEARDNARRQSRRENENLQYSSSMTRGTRATTGEPRGGWQDCS
jgi:tetratricopeptide (TPR) repeat protein